MDRQEILDTFYFENGPCCAGCDWWRHLNSRVGECTKSAPVGHEERWAMVSIELATLYTGSGHIATDRSHHCGDFKDQFDWSSLPLPYLKRVGAPLPKA
jgi:hypothetical protein